MQVGDTEHNVSDDLAGRVRRAIRRQGYIRLCSVRCKAEGSTVVLSGKLPSYYLKQVAQSIASNVPGVKKVVNETQVIQ